MRGVMLIVALSCAAPPVPTDPPREAAAPTSRLAPTALDRSTQFSATLTGVPTGQRYKAGVGSACIPIEALDLLSVVPEANIVVPFAAYQATVRSAVEEAFATAARDVGGDRPLSLEEEIARGLPRFRRVWAAVDAAQAELFTRLELSEVQKSLVLRASRWQRYGTDDPLAMFDVEFFFESEREATATRLRDAINAAPSAAARLGTLLVEFDASVGPMYERLPLVHRVRLHDPEPFAPSARELQTRYGDVHEAHRRLLGEIQSVAIEAGAAVEGLRWRATTFKRWVPSVFPPSDLLDVFEAAYAEGEANNEAALAEVIRRALADRDLAMEALLEAIVKVKRRAFTKMPIGADMERLVRQLASRAAEFERIEQRLGVELKGQLRDPRSAAGRAVDAYLADYETFAWQYWRESVAFFSAFIEGRRGEPESTNE